MFSQVSLRVFDWIFCFSADQFVPKSLKTNITKQSLYGCVYCLGSRGGAVVRAPAFHRCGLGSILGQGVISGLVCCWFSPCSEVFFFSRFSGSSSSTITNFCWEFFTYSSHEGRLLDTEALGESFNHAFFFWCCKPRGIVWRGASPGRSAKSGLLSAPGRYMHWPHG